MSPAEEKAAADLWIGRMKDLATRFATVAGGITLPEAGRTMMHQVTELQFAQIATVEAAIAGGMPLRTAVEVARTIGAFATGVDLVGQFPAGVPSTAVEENLETMGQGVIHAITTTLAVEGVDRRAPVAALIEPTHSDHLTRQ